MIFINKHKNKILILAILTLATILIWNALPINKEVKLDDVKINKTNSNNLLAVLVEQEGGTYLAQNSFPTEGYVYNAELSGCMDKDGNIIENALSYSNGTLTISAKKAVNCYAYFDIQQVIRNLLEVVESETEANGVYVENSTEYRYEGPNPKNYIDFNGETWRIIGSVIVSGESSNLVKIVRDTSIGNLVYGDPISTTGWGNSSLYTVLNTQYYGKTGDYTSIGISSNASDAYGKMVKNVNGWRHAGQSSGNGYGSYDVSDYYSNEYVTSGRVGVISVSDYGYAADYDRGNRLDDTSYGDDNWEASNWLHRVQWTANYFGYSEFAINSANKSNSSKITMISQNRLAARPPVEPSEPTYYTNGVYITEDYGLDGSTGMQPVYPVVYLDPTVYVTRGDGSSTNHYQIAMD